MVISSTGWWPADRIRSAIVILETEAGETFQLVLGPSRWQGIEFEMQQDVEYVPEWRPDRLNPILETRYTHTITLVAGELRGQIRTPTGSATQVDPQAIERTTQ